MVRKTKSAKFMKSYSETFPPELVVCFIFSFLFIVDVSLSLSVEKKNKTFKNNMERKYLQRTSNILLHICNQNQYTHAESSMNLNKKTAAVAQNESALCDVQCIYNFKLCQ